MDQELTAHVRGNPTRLMPIMLHAGTSPGPVETLRLIRNDCRRFMTRYREEISQAQQLAWWSKIDHATTRVFLYILTDGTPIGYGLVVQEDSRRLVSGGLLAEYRGIGLGENIFGHLSSLQDETWLEVLETNVRARRLYENLGFKAVSLNNGVLLMCKRKNEP